MENIDRVEKLSGIDNIRTIKKEKSYEQFETLLKTYSPNPEKKNHSFKRENKDDEKKNNNKSLKKKFNFQQIQSALEQAIKKFNEILDLQKAKYYVFYELLNDKNISLKIADVKSGEYISQRIICLDCIENENDMFRLIEDLAKKEGLFLDVDA